MRVVIRLELPADAAGRKIAIRHLQTLDIWNVGSNDVRLACTEEEARALSDAYPVEYLVEVDAITPAARAGASESFHDFDTLCLDLAKLAAQSSGIAAVRELGTTEQGREIWGLRISKKAEVLGLPRIIVAGCHHAREWISVEIPYLIASRLLREASDPAIHPFLNEAEFWFVPMLNPDGHAYSTTRPTNPGEGRPREWRKNRRDNGNGSFGVDLNRNYDIDWNGAGSSGSTWNRLYRGPSPFSEPETQVMRGLATCSSLVGAVSYHSFGLEFVYPFGFADPSCDRQCQNDLASLQMVAEKMALIAQQHESQRYRAISAIDHYEDQSISGDCADWIFSQMRVPAITVELRPAFGNQLGFEIEPEEIRPTFEENWNPLIEFLRFALDKPTADPSSYQEQARRSGGS